MSTEILEFEAPVECPVTPAERQPALYRHYLEWEAQYELKGYPVARDELPDLVVLRHRKTGKLHVTTLTDLHDGIAANGEKRWTLGS